MRITHAQAHVTAAWAGIGVGKADTAGISEAARSPVERGNNARRLPRIE